MDLGFVVGLVLIMSGLFRLFLVRSGKLPTVFGFQRYIPYLFLAVGAAIFVLALVD